MAHNLSAWHACLLGALTCLLCCFTQCVCACGKLPMLRAEELRETSPGSAARASDH